MKELYIAPELEILCFAPMEGIASMYPVLTTKLPISEIEGTDYIGDDEWADEDF